MSWRKQSERKFDLCNSSTPRSVGPGSYDISEARKAEKSSFSQAKYVRSPFGPKISKSPGPGYYFSDNEQNEQKLSSTFASRSTREVYLNNESPAPTEHCKIEVWAEPKKAKKKKGIQKKVHYVPNFGEDVLGYVVSDDGVTRPIKKVKSDGSMIGPGQYSPQLPECLKKHSLDTSYRDSIFVPRSSTPGPGKYDPYDYTKRICRKLSARREEKNPDPPKSGDLTHNDISSKASNPSPSFVSKAERELWAKEDPKPDPTKYSVDVAFSSGNTSRSFSKLTPRFRDDDTLTPGPGYYEINKNHWIKKNENHQTVKFRKEPESSEIGPGYYEVVNDIRPKSQKPSPVFTAKPGKSVLDVDDDKPGPGHYSPIIQSKTISKDLHKSSPHSSRLGADSDIPPPGHYNTGQNLSTKGFKMPKSKRFNHSEGVDIPGPGSYLVDHDHDGLIKKSYNSDLKNM